MTCSVVIPCFNGVAWTRRCVQSLLEQTEPPGEILIVDNGSDDGTAALGEEFGAPVRILSQTRNLGFAGGVNAGLRAAAHEEVLILNNDTCAAPNMLAALRCALHHAPDIGAAAPVSNHVKGEGRLPIGDHGARPEGRRELADALAGAPVVQDVETLAGLCLLMRRTTLDDVGVFDERFGHGNYEDDDLCLRLRLRGYRLVLARRAFLHHEGHATFRAMGLDLAEQLRVRLRLFHEKWCEHPAGLATLAHLYGRPRVAAAAAEEALRRCPTWPDAWLHLGRFHERHGDAERAATCLRAYLAAHPEHVDAALKLALALLRAGHRVQAQRRLDRTLARHRLTPAQHSDLLERLGQLCLDQGLHEVALGHFSELAAAAPDHAEAHHGRGLALLALARLEEARDAFRAAIDRGHALAYTNLGVCLHRLGDQDAAVESFAQGAAALPDDPVAQANYEAVLAARDAATC